MGLRFRKSIKIAPGVKVNLGKKSAGISVGNKYGGVSVNSKTGARARVSAPGTGLSYSKKIGKSASRNSDYGVTTFYVSDDENETNEIPTQESLCSKILRTGTWSALCPLGTRRTGVLDHRRTMLLFLVQIQKTIQRRDSSIGAAGRANRRGTG